MKMYPTNIYPVINSYSQHDDIIENINQPIFDCFEDKLTEDTVDFYCKDPVSVTDIY